MPDAVRSQYDRLAGRYDRRWSWYVSVVARETLRRMPLPTTGRLLDVGCGTGVLLEMIKDRAPGLELHGADLSRGMLAIARARLGGAAQLHLARAEALPFRDESFDVVVSASVFHYLRDPVAALREMARVLSPSGVLVITDWCDDYLACRVCDRVLRVLDPAHFRTYRAAECRELLAAAAVTRASVERYRVSWLWGLMTAMAWRNTARASYSSGPR